MKRTLLAQAMPESIPASRPLRTASIISGMRKGAKGFVPGSAAPPLAREISTLGVPFVRLYRVDILKDARGFFPETPIWKD